jgi:NitT/TauT family transport system permease protein
MSSVTTRAQVATVAANATVVAGPVRPAHAQPAFSLWRLLRAIAMKSVAILAFLALWQAYPVLFPDNAVWLPSFTTVLDALWGLARSGDLAEHIQASLTRSMSGFGLAVAVAIPLGLLIGWYRPVADLLSPLLELFRNTAALAILPVFILILGLGEVSKISLVLYACTWPILLNTIAGVKGVDPLLVKSAKSMGLGPLRLFQKVILPAAVPTIFTGIRLAGAFSILVLIAAELVGAKEGLGFLIVNSQSNFAIPEMYAGILTTAVLGVAVNQALLALERRFSTWRPQ